MAMRDDEPKSRSQLKRDFQELKTLCRELVGLSAKQLEAMPIDDDARAAILSAKNMSRGALQRQLRYLVRLMEHEDVDAVRAALQESSQPHTDEVAAFHQIERWRDELIDGDDAHLMGFVGEHPQFDRQRLRQLIQNARRERDRDKPPKAARQLFQYLKSASQE